jgi:hypothetical protein
MQQPREAGSNQTGRDNARMPPTFDGTQGSQHFSHSQISQPSPPVYARPAQGSQPLYSSQPAAFSLSQPSQSETLGDQDRNQVVQSARLPGTGKRNAGSQPIAQASSGDLAGPVASNRPIQAHGAAAQTASGLLNKLNSKQQHDGSRRAGQATGMQAWQREEMLALTAAVTALTEKVNKMVEQHDLEHTAAQDVAHNTEQTLQKLQQAMDQVCSAQLGLHLTDAWQAACPCEQL